MQYPQEEDARRYRTERERVGTLLAFAIGEAMRVFDEDEVVDIVHRTYEGHRLRGISAAGSAHVA